MARVRNDNLDSMRALVTAVAKDTRSPGFETGLSIWI
jgi:hypothetical protein